MIRKSKFTVLLTLLSFIIIFASQICQAKKYRKFGLGAGLGANFAHTIGISGSYWITNHFEAITALGSQNHYSIGGRYHLLDGTGFWQPRFGINFGTNGDRRVFASASDPNLNDYPQTYLGFTVTAGTKIAFGRPRKHALGFDIGYKLTTGGFERDRREHEKDSDTIRGGHLFSGLTDVFTGGTRLQLSIGWEMKF